MKNSSPIAAQKAEAEARERAVTAYVNHEISTLVGAGLTASMFDSAESGGNRAPAEAKFTRVTLSKRAQGSKPSKSGKGRSRQFPSSLGSQPDASFPALGGMSAEVPQWKDPFGAGAIPADVNPTSTGGFLSARTKQCARKSTGAPMYRSRSWVPKPRVSQALNSSGSSSNRSTSARRYVKGAVQDRAAASAEKGAAKTAKAAEASLAKKRARAAHTEPVQTGSEGSDGFNSDSSSQSGKAATPGGKPATVKLSATGRFNGRIHATPTDGSCGPASLLEALKHLANTRGYQFSIPEDADALRAALVQDVRENLGIEGLSEGMPTLLQEITEEYFPGDRCWNSVVASFAPSSTQSNTSSSTQPKATSR